MKKHPQIKSTSLEGSCNYECNLLLNNLKVSQYAFKKYVKQSNFIHSPSKTIKAYKLPCGCYLWLNKNGSRELSLLPF
jgi:hypothetical protein